MNQISKNIVNFKVHSGFCDNYFSLKRHPVQQYRLDFFYELNHGVIFLVMELMINDKNPGESKILNYTTYIEVLDNTEVVEKNLEQFIRLVKFNELLFNTFKSKVNNMLRLDFSEFKYADLSSDMSYYNLMNNHYDVHDRVVFPLQSDCEESNVEFWI